MLMIALLTGASASQVACIPRSSATDQGLHDAVGWVCYSGQSGMNCNDLPADCSDDIRAKAHFAFSKYYNIFGSSGGSCDFGGRAQLATPAQEFSGCVNGASTDPPTDPPTERPTPTPTPRPTNPPTDRPTPTPVDPPTNGVTPVVACVPKDSATEQGLGDAVGWTCHSGQSGINCNDMPSECNTNNRAKATFAFSKYYATFGSQGAHTCDFGGRAHIGAPSAALVGCVYGSGETPAPAPPTPTPTAPEETPAPAPLGPSSRCGIATSVGKCAETQQAVGAAMECFSYGGTSDTCSLNNNNDPNNGLDKNPNDCAENHFFLWDEPDTQGYNYGWAGVTWRSYCTRWSSELNQFKARGGKVVGPAVKNDKYVNNMVEFMNACGSACTAEGPCKIDEAAANVFVGSWNNGNLRGGIQWSIDQFERFNTQTGLNLPVSITNWSYLGSNTADAQLDAMRVTDEFFKADNPVTITQAYYFLARDFGGGTTNNLATDRTSEGTTLGEHWRNICQDLDN